VLAARPRARLLIVGSGPFEAELRRCATELGIADRVTFTTAPAGDSAAMAAVLAGVSIVVLMSEYETHPLVGLEAAAARRRLLVADRGGLLELGRDGLARTIALHSSGLELGDAILKELAKPPPREAPPLTTWDDCAAELLALYRSVIAGAAGSGSR
jgi:glycosyltransferase involved in cell wall biosynthesis